MIFGTNPKIITAAITDNSALIKVNQIGPITETLEAMQICPDAGYTMYEGRHRLPQGGETSGRLVQGVAMDVQQYVSELAQVNRNGFGFLLAYGFTWIIAAALGWRFGERVGTYAALFQGMVGLPLGLLLTMAAADGTRPEDPTLNALSIYLSMGQLLILPLVIVLITQERYTVAVAALAVTLAVHFVPYSWLYDTPIYIAVAAVVALGTAILVAIEPPRGSTGSQVCALTGSTLLLGGVLALAS